MAVTGASCPDSVRKTVSAQRTSAAGRAHNWRRRVLAAALTVTALPGVAVLPGMSGLPGIAGTAQAAPTGPLRQSPDGTVEPAGETGSTPAPVAEPAPPAPPPGAPGAPAAEPAPEPPPRPRFEEFMVPSSMGPVKVQVQWAKNGGDAGLYLLDGLRARDDFNAWTFETNALQLFADDNINLVMPVGGQSSFYTDWRAPSSTNGQKFTYKWETFLTEELPAFLEPMGVSRTKNAIAGLSMGGSAALALAAYHRDMFKHASSFSGYLNISAPGMREAIRLAMLDAGRFNVDSMAWPWSPQWLRMDPFVFAPQLRGLPMYISASWGVLGAHDDPENGAFNTLNAVALEALSMLNTVSFMSRMNELGIGAHYSLPTKGTHSWGYWQDQLTGARPDILAALGA
ncbi:alpha/beta hydrolase [Nocardia sp. NPDC056100]|uniref:alpha/beta hydrolase n=1 Tax=Nocardia sp. NPDC056100 TaxID=3345712 RepID=UPI0035DC44A6